jgi:hypothetical protein
VDDLSTTDACTLPTAQRPLRLAEFDALFSDAARAVAWRDVAVRIRLAGPRGLKERVRDLAERETACCSFFTFLVEGDDDDLTLDISVPSEHRDILVAVAGRAAELGA